MSRRIVKLHANRVTFTGMIPTEVIRDRAAAFEALTGSYPEIRVKAPHLPKRAIMGGSAKTAPESIPDALVTGISRMFLSVAIPNMGVFLICPDAVPELEVSFVLETNGRRIRH